MDLLRWVDEKLEPAGSNRSYVLLVEVFVDDLSVLPEVKGI